MSPDVPVGATMQVLGKAESAASGVYYRARLSQKLVLTESDNLKKPKYFIPTTLFQGMRNAVKNHLEILRGMTYVYFGPRRTGKTTAAIAFLQFLVEKSPKNYPCKFIDAGASLRISMREDFGVPDGVNDKEFFSDLCYKLLGKQNGVPSSTDTYSNQLCIAPPVLVLDNVRSFSKDDQKCLDILYKACYECRIVLFILTDEEHIANMICGMNGNERIQPLPNNYETEEDDWIIVQDTKAVTGNVAKGLVWKPQHWNRKKLSKIVKDCYDDFDWSGFKDDEDGEELNFATDGMLPDSVMALAEKIIAKTASPMVRSFIDAMDDPEYDDKLRDELKKAPTENING